MNLSERIRRFYTPSSKLPREQQRYFVIVAVLLSLSLVSHVLYIALFHWMGLSVLRAYNVVSVVILSAALWLNNRGHRYAPANIAALEIYTYVVLCGVYLGREAGAIYLLIIPVLAVAIFPYNNWYKIIWVIGIALGGILLYFRIDSSAWDGPQYILDLFYIQNFLIAFGISLMTAIYLATLVKTAERSLDKALAQSDKLLNNVMPSVIADRLKETNEVIADSFPETSILFADIVDFTPLSKTMTPAEVVNLLNDLFSRIDPLVDKHQLEKIKTIGDAYMVAAGVPVRRDDHAEAIVAFALELQEVLTTYNRETGHNLQFRIGINSGPVVAGVIGKLRFLYDLWGDSVNTASRMESHGIPNEIQVTEDTRNLLIGKYDFEDRGVVEIKGKGPMRTYLLRV